MQFDPKIIRPDEGAFDQSADLQLPDDLAIMAEQLAEDAARLAASYPARLPPQSLPLAVPAANENSRLRRVWLSPTLIGGSLAAVLLTLSIFGNSFFRPQHTATKTPAAAASSASATAVIAGRGTSAHDPEDSIPVTHASWLGETSGPELEALMDLWERDQHEVASLSF